MQSSESPASPESPESPDASSGLPSEDIPSYTFYDGVTEVCTDWDCDQSGGGVVSAAGNFFTHFGSAILGMLVGIAVIAAIVVLVFVAVKFVQKRKAAKSKDGNYVLLEGDEGI